MNQIICHKIMNAINYVLERKSYIKNIHLQRFMDIKSDFITSTTLSHFFGGSELPFQLFLVNNFLKIASLLFSNNVMRIPAAFMFVIILLTKRAKCFTQIIKHTKQKLKQFAKVYTKDHAAASNIESFILFFFLCLRITVSES